MVQQYFKDNKIIELSFITTDKENYLNNNQKVIDIYVKTKVPAEITELTGITQDKLDKDGVSELEMVYTLLDQIPTNEKCLLTAHNAQFDVSFIFDAFKRYGLEKFIEQCDYLDTLTVFKDRRPYPHRLKNAIEAYDLKDVQNSHLAADDTMALFMFTRALAEERDDLDLYINIFGYNPKYGVNGQEFEKVFYAGQNYRKFMASQSEILPALIGRKCEEIIPTKLHIKATALPKEEKRVVIKGEVINYEFFKKTLKKHFPDTHITIITGGETKGIDTYSDKLAEEWNTKKVVFKPDWRRFQRKAGHVRNSTMIKYAAEAKGYLIVFGNDPKLEKQATNKGLEVINV